MKRFLNFRFFRRAASFIVYAMLLSILISDMFRSSSTGSEMGHQQYMTWWTLFLVLDIWFFGLDDRFGSKSKND